MERSHDEIYEQAQNAVIEAMGVDEDEVTPDTTIMGELGAESIDLLDILYRMERKLGVKVQASDLAAYIQGGIPDEEFGDEQGIITERGLSHLKTVMPQINPDELAGTMEAEKVMQYFTVQNLADMYAKRLNGVAG